MNGNDSNARPENPFPTVGSGPSVVTVPPPPPKQPGKTPVGPIIGAVIVVIILVIGGLYYWGSILDKRDAASVEDIQTAGDASLDTLSSQGTSDEVSAIEEDLNATDLGGLDAELGNIERELAQ